MSNVIIPVAKKILVCDDVVRDPLKGKTSILNVWSQIRAKGNEFPFTLGKLCVYALFRGGLGDIPIRIEIAKAGFPNVVAKGKTFVLPFRDKNRTHQARCMMREVVFPSPGAYVVEMYCNDQFVDDQLIRIILDAS